MPFLQDIDADDEALQRPIWGAFALLKDNIERLLAANLFWSVNLFPGILALAFPAIPAVLRVIMVLYTLTALVPATGVLYIWMARVTRGEPLTLAMVQEDLQEFWLPILLHLMPLFALLGTTLLLIILASSVHFLILDTLLRFALLILVVCALYWGPLFAEFPDRSPLFLLQTSLRLFWRYPGATMLTGLVVLLVSAVGAATVVMYFVIVPTLVALLQTRRCLELLAREDARSAKISNRARQHRSKVISV
jgi:hypothetical protein